MRRWTLLAVFAIIASATWIGLADPPASADPPITVKLGPLPAIKLQPRFDAQVAALPAVDADVRGDAYGLIASLIQSAPDLARRAIDQYLKDRSAGRCFTVAEALSAGDESWEANVLLPMLADKRSVKWGRVCDEAAATLSQLYPDLKFTDGGSDADRDKQINAMKKFFSAHPPGK